MVLVSFDSSIVRVKQSFIVTQIVSCPFVPSWLVLLDSVNGRLSIAFTANGKREIQVEKFSKCVMSK